MKRLGQSQNRQKTMIAILAALMILLSFTLSGCGKADESAVILGTGGEGGNYYSYGVNLSNYLSDADSDYSMEVQTTAGSAANLRLISDEYVNMAIAQSDTVADALNGTGSFQGGALSGFHSVASLYTENCQIVVRADSDLGSVADLAGKRISIGEKDSGVVSNARTILSAYGISLQDAEISHLSFADSAEALKKGEIDAFFCTASAPTTAVVDLGNETDIRLLPVSDEISQAIIGGNAAYVNSVIPAGTYKGQDADIATVGVSAVLIASDNLDPAIEAAVVDVLNKNNENIQEISFGVAPAQPEEEEEASGMLTLNIDMYLTLGIAVLILFLGIFLRKKITFLETFCIPSPVVGGLVFAIVAWILYSLGVVEFVFDDTLRTVCMVIFFTSVGFQANLKVLKKGGVGLVLFLVLVIIMILCQNAIAVGLSSLMNISPLIGLCTGSIPMVGGHGTAGAFGPVLEDLGLAQGSTLCTAAATFGLVAGSLMGGPLGRRLILKKDLIKTAAIDVEESEAVLAEDEEKHRRNISMYAPAAYQLAIAMGIGTIVSTLLSKTGMTFPIYIGAMIVAAIIRNVGEYSGKYKVHMGEINDLGGICLSMFLGIAMITLKLWQLTDLALPLIVLLCAQVIFMFLFAYFVVFNVMGRDYDAAILSAGTCGFGMGATPNAMANMQALTDRFVPSVKAYLLVPIVGSMFADFLNSIAITFFINVV